MIPFERVFRLLNEHDIRYVIVGGIAVILHGSPRLTADLDIIIDLEPMSARRAIEALQTAGFGRKFLSTSANSRTKTFAAVGSLRKI
jgi:hypothetical protein